MTCIVAITDGQAVIFGADSAAAKGDEICSMPESKIFRAGSYVFGVSGSYRVKDVLRFKAELPEPPPGDLKPFLVTTLMPAIADAVRADGADHEGRRILGPRTSLLIGVRGQLWHVDPDLTVLAEGSFASVGSGYIRAYAALHALEAAKVEPAKRRIELALEAAAAYTSTVRGPWWFVESGAPTRS